MIHVRCKNGVLEWLYEDGVSLAGVRNVRVVRMSSIEPCESTGIQFKIVWRGPVAKAIGENVTYRDFDKSPFTTRAQAVTYERKRLLRDYFKVPNELVGS